MGRATKMERTHATFFPPSQTYHAGLSLTMASKMLLLDITPNALMEKQLIGRVHRIGQQREVTIVRCVHLGAAWKGRHVGFQLV